MGFGSVGGRSKHAAAVTDTMAMDPIGSTRVLPRLRLVNGQPGSAYTINNAVQYLRLYLVVTIELLPNITVVSDSSIPRTSLLNHFWRCINCNS